MREMEERKKEEGRERVKSVVVSSLNEKHNNHNKNNHRPSLKSESQINNYESWKHKLRENCYKRVQEERSRLLWKFRFPNSLLLPNSNPNQVTCALKDIVSDELNKIKHNDDDDLLWEWDYDHDPTYQGDCEEILLEMQRLFYDDYHHLNSHSHSQPLINANANDLDTTWEDQVDDYLAQALYQHMHLNADNVHREEIWCPICKQGELKEDRNLIYCTLCELRLNKNNELNLGFLRDRLAEAHSEHLDRGCRLKPRFCIKTEFGLTALYISCEGCDTFEVVF